MAMFTVVVTFVRLRAVSLKGMIWFMLLMVIIQIWLNLKLKYL